MEENKKVVPDDVSPVKKEKKSKQKKKSEKPVDTTPKTIVLDNFGKSIMKTFIIKTKKT